MPFKFSFFSISVGFNVQISKCKIAFFFFKHLSNAGLFVRSLSYSQRDIDWPASTDKCTYPHGRQ